MIKTWKRIAAVIVAGLTMCMASVPQMQVALLDTVPLTAAADYTYEGLYYQYQPDDTIVITGCDSVSSVEIPSEIDEMPVTKIGDGAFKYCSRLGIVVIPDTVTSIGDSAFQSCTSLTSITIPDSVTSIGDSAFYNCTRLTGITIPAGVTSIGDNAFDSCTGLTSITIPAGVTSIGNSMFYRCKGLTSITIPDSVTSNCNSYREQDFIKNS